MTPQTDPRHPSGRNQFSGRPTGGASSMPGGDVGRHGPSATAVAALVGWAALLAGSAAVLHGVGGALAPPPLTDLGELGRWFEQRQAPEAAFAVLRLLALGLAWYLLVVTVAGTMARAVGSGSLVRMVDALSVPLVRGLVNGAVGVSFTAVALTGVGSAALADERATPPVPSAAATETMRRLPDVLPSDDPPPTSTTSAVPTGRASATATSPAPTMRRLPADRPDDATTTTTLSPSVAPESPAPATRSSGPPTWQVRPGDHFWGVAERVLAEAWHRTPTDAEVDPYWRALVDANQAGLRSPGNPDLLFPDQVIAIPAPPPAPAAAGG